jgi:hypothetical protein
MTNLLKIKIKKIKFKGTDAYQLGTGKKAVVFIPKFWKRKDFY